MCSSILLTNGKLIELEQNTSEIFSGVFMPMADTRFFGMLYIKLFFQGDIVMRTGGEQNHLVDNLILH